MFRILGLVLSLSLPSFAFAQHGELPPNPEPGKCYAQCLTPGVEAQPAQTTNTTYRRYVGSEDIKFVTRYHDVRIDENGKVTERIAIQEPKNIRSLAEEDVVLDTYSTYHAEVKGRPAGAPEWQEIVCSGDVTDKIVQQLADKLRNKGFQLNGVHTVLDADVKKVMIEFQLKNELSVGQLTFQTLNALGVDY